MFISYVDAYLLVDQVEDPSFSAIFTPKINGSTHVIMYVHGGGFTTGSPEGVSSYLLQFSVELHSLGVLADIFCVGYNLAPETPYPGSLKQVVATYEYLKSRGKPIILMGDSAGGNLCLGLLRHLQKPRPGLPIIKDITSQSDTGIVSLCLACPWVNLRNDTIPPQLLSGRDCLAKVTLDRWRDAYMDGKPLDEYANPMQCSEGWKCILPPSVLFMTGELDSFSRDILHLAEVMKRVPIPGKPIS